MEIVKVEYSKIDNSIKYVFLTADDLIVEFTYINKNDGKIIICCPTQTMCNIGCLYCHTTEYRGKILSRNIERDEFNYCVGTILFQQDILESNKDLLISFMGIGEPLFNITEIILFAKDLLLEFENKKKCRFALATILPLYSNISFEKFTNLVRSFDLNFKIHFSLHHMTNDVRKLHIPFASILKESKQMLINYANKTNNPIEIHYTLIEGVNDSNKDVRLLYEFVKDIPKVNVKFLGFNTKETLKYNKAGYDRVQMFREFLTVKGISNEYYEAPGKDIGSSCGSFNMENYIIQDKTKI